MNVKAFWTYGPQIYSYYVVYYGILFHHSIRTL